MYVCGCACACACVCVCARVHVCVCVFECVYIYIYICVCVFACSRPIHQAYCSCMVVLVGFKRCLVVLHHLEGESFILFRLVMAVSRCTRDRETCIHVMYAYMRFMNPLAVYSLFQDFTEEMHQNMR